MKNTLYVFMFFLSMIVHEKANAQLLSYEELENAIISVNSQLPLSLGLSMQWNSYTINHERVSTIFSVNDLGNAMQLNQMSDQERKESAMMMLTGMMNEPELSFLNSMIDLGLDMQIIYESENNGTRVKIDLTPDDLREMLVMSVDSEKKLEISLNGTRKILPVNIGYGLRMREIILTDESVVFFCDVEEEQIDMDLFISKKDTVLKGIEDSVSSLQDFVAILQFALILDTGRSVSYKYTGTITGKSIQFDIPYERLVSLFSTNREK